MIKINLLPRRKKVSRSHAKGEQSLLIGLAIIAALIAAVFFLIHKPITDKTEAQESTNKVIERENKTISDQIKGLGELRAAIKAAIEKRDAIAALNNARATPAWFLYELSQVLTRGGSPSMTDEMVKEMRDNPNREWQANWDAKHVWITKISEKDGRFTLEGGAQSDADITQLALRLQSSMFFDDVKPAKAGSASDQKSGVTYYTFTITGAVRY
jgi:Tfp pilus assembly protein PilN